MRTFCFDCETTGLKHEVDNVVEVGWVELVHQHGDYTLVEPYSSLVKSPTPMSYAASGVNSIRDEDLVNSPTISEIPFPKGPIRFVAHNAKFDIGFLSPHLDIVKEICTWTLAKRTVKGVEDFRLTTLVAALELSRGLAHRAELDAINVGELLIQIMTRTGLNLEQVEAFYKKPFIYKTMTFGNKHLGKPMAEVPKGYLYWMRENVKMDKDLSDTVDHYLRRR